MPTQHPRIQVTLDKETSHLLATLAERQQQSMSATASALIRDAIELHEDRLLSDLSNQRIDTDNGVRIAHDDAWK